MQKEEINEEREGRKGLKTGRVGIYGGTFDPVHIGHLISAEAVYHACDLDKVVFIPAYNPPHKKNRSINAQARLAMLKLATEDNDHFEVDDREILSKEVNYTLNTILDLRAEHPDLDFYYIMGEDSLLQVEQWYEWKKLLSLIRLVVVKRPRSQDIAYGSVDADRKTMTDQVNFLRGLGYELTVVDQFAVDISSSSLREYLREGRDTRYLIPDKVLDYIKGENLYDQPESK